MLRIVMSLLVTMVLVFSGTTYARQGGGGGGEDLKGVCELAGGTWTGNEGGNWACCWANWGCYGCYNGVCKMQCRTQRCRDANRVRRTTSGTRTINDLAPSGMKAPVVPVKSMRR